MEQEERLQEEVDSLDSTRRTSIFYRQLVIPATSSTKPVTVTSTSLLIPFFDESNKYPQLTMRILQRISTLVSISGCSRPPSWTSPRKRLLYKIYTAVMFLFVHTLLASQILDLALNVDNQDDFSDSLYLALGIMSSCCKMWTLLASRGYYEIDNLQEEPLLPVNTDEIEIQMRFDKMAKWNATAYTILIEFLLGWMFDFESRRLKFRGWIPYDYSTPVSFIVTYIHQVASLSICALQNIACETLFGGLLIHIYSQFEMLGYRLENITKDEKSSARECARHHEHIYKFATMVTRIFKMIVFTQFLISTMILCFDLDRFTQQDLGSRFLETLHYAFCTLIQILYYCWYGNEVQLKSLEIPDAILRSNWTSFNDSTKRIPLMIMRRATVPIRFTSMYIVSMNLDSFKTILKTSYSAFNVLQQGQR